MGNRHSALPWMGPQLAKAGLVESQGWASRHVEQACALFPDKELHPAIGLLAVLGERAIDYIRQAPVLVLAATHGGDVRRAMVRERVAYRFGSLVRRGARLRDVMAFFGLPVPMRKILAAEISLGRRTLLLQRLATMLEPSALSQAIPEDAREQAAWMIELAAFDRQALYRLDVRAMGPKLYAERFAWLAPALTRAMAAGEGLGGADLVLDFFASEGRPFNPKWSWLRAKELSDQWHRDQAGLEDVAKLGFSTAHEFDYGAFPDSARVRGLDFVALRSVLALREEGRTMRHCVGGYFKELAGGHRFYSIRCEGRRLATAQIVGFAPVQVKGPLNATPKADVIGAINAFLKGVEKGADFAGEAAEDTA